MPVADRDSIYDPTSSNGRLLLGLKGQLAEVELTRIRSHLIAGLENKAKRGELAVNLPAALTRDLQGRVIKNPNIELVHSIQLVFDTFLSCKSALQVVKYFHIHQLKIPIYDKHKDLIWCEATPTRILRILRNPAYAGAFVYGRRKTIRNGISTVDIKRRFVPPEQWRIIVKDKYPSYISWSAFEINQEIIRNNYAEYNKRISSGMPRKGELLLQGIAYCGCCGHKYFVVYKNYNKYICHQKNSQRYGAAICQKISAEQIDDAVVKAFFKALSPIELDAYAQAQQLGKITKEKMKISYMRELERLRYQAKLAERQFNQVDPDNRLVANELEKRWENALREVSEAEKQFQIKIEKLFEPSEQISIEMKEAFMQIGQRLPQVWNTLIAEQKKAFLRCLINKVVMHRITADVASVRIVWKGNSFTEIKVPLRVNSADKLSYGQDLKNEMERLIMLSEMDDKEIAIELTKKIFRKGGSSARRKEPEYLSIKEISDKLSIKASWIYYCKDKLPLKQDIEKKLNLLPVELLDEVKKLHDQKQKSSISSHQLQG